MQSAGVAAISTPGLSHSCRGLRPGRLARTPPFHILREGGRALFQSKGRVATQGGVWHARVSKAGVLLDYARHPSRFDVKTLQRSASVFRGTARTNDTEEGRALAMLFFSVPRFTMDVLRPVSVSKRIDPV